MKRVCTTQPGVSVCCTAATQGMLNKPFRFTDRSGHERCAQCDVVASQSKRPGRAGQPVFRFRFHKSQECGIIRGCPALAQGQGAITGPQGGTFAPALPLG
jgi:hypothetical protein